MTEQPDYPIQWMPPEDRPPEPVDTEFEARIETIKHAAARAEATYRPGNDYPAHWQH